MERILATERLGVHSTRPSIAEVGEYLFGWPPAPHHLVWLHYMNKLRRGEIPDNRLLIIAPPAHAKTNWAGVAFPTHYLGENPEEHVLYFSATSRLAEASSRAVRDTIANNARFRSFYPGVVPDRSKGWSGNQWFLNRKNVGDKDPSFMAAGVGSESVIGIRGNLIVFDDISTKENSRTAYRRETVRTWVQQVAFSRQTRDAAMLAIMTRWHAEDIAAFFESDGGFTVIHMTANGYWDDPGHPERASIDGDPLWEEEYNAAFLKRMRLDLGDWLYSATYQGIPAAPEGAILREEHFQPYFIPFWNPAARKLLESKGKATEPPYNAIITGAGEVMPITYTALMADTAFSDRDVEGASYTVFALWGVGMDKKAYLLDVYRERVESTLLYDRFIDFWKLHQPNMAVIENRASGIQLAQDLQRKTSIPISTTYPMGSKEERLRSAAHIVRGAFRLPDPGETPHSVSQWVEDFLAEHLEFPRGAHDDQVDTTSMAVEHLKVRLEWWFGEGDDYRSMLADDQVRKDPLFEDAREEVAGELLVTAGEGAVDGRDQLGAISNSRFGVKEDWLR